MAQHAKLSPSASHRWMNCPASVRLIGDQSSEAGHAAMLGTAVHKVIETLIEEGESNASKYLNWAAFVHKPGKSETVLSPPGTEIQPDKITDGWFLFIMDETAIAGAQMMMDEIERVKAELFDAAVFSERFLDMTWLDSRLGGTADVTLVEFGGAGGWIDLFDYKNGRVVVEVVDNEQFLNYAVGLLHEHPECVGVRVHLVQPNAFHEEGCIRVISYTADEIKLFELNLKRAADATSAPNAPLRAGEWCTYCPAKDRCTAFAGLVQNEAGIDFAADPVDAYEPPVPVLVDLDGLDDDGAETYTDPDEYRAALDRKARLLPLLEQFGRDIRQKLMNELMGGGRVGDWKIVRGRANRAWNGEGKDFIQQLAQEAELWDGDLVVEKMKSPAQVEKLGSGKDTKALIKSVVAKMSHKPEGKLALAAGSDPRPAIDPSTMAAADFANDPLAGDESDFQ